MKNRPHYDFKDERRKLLINGSELIMLEHQERWEETLV